MSAHLRYDIISNQANYYYYRLTRQEGDKVLLSDNYYQVNLTALLIQYLVLGAKEEK